MIQAHFLNYSTLSFLFLVCLTPSLEPLSASSTGARLFEDSFKIILARGRYLKPTVAAGAAIFPRDNSLPPLGSLENHWKSEDLL